MTLLKLMTRIIRGRFLGESKTDHTSAALVNLCTKSLPSIIAVMYPAQLGTLQIVASKFTRSIYTCNYVNCATCPVYTIQCNTMHTRVTRTSH